MLIEATFRQSFSLWRAQLRHRVSLCHRCVWCDFLCFPLWCSSCVSSFQESLLRMLLGIEMLQVILCMDTAKDNCITPLQRMKQIQNNTFCCVHMQCIFHTCSAFFFSLMQTFTINILLEKLPEFMLDRSVFLVHFTAF